ncbi:MAG: hypothetical protein N4Q32_00165 [Neisseriaceae bacterium]|nr:hypothetical protein [Neisseriaceae bacterium PsAf]MCV2508843.1 hypothetical protein [Neisseriaceae bacterium]
MNTEEARLYINNILGLDPSRFDTEQIRVLVSVIDRGALLNEQIRVVANPQRSPIEMITLAEEFEQKNRRPKKSPSPRLKF